MTDKELLDLQDRVRAARLARTKFVGLDDDAKRAYKAEKAREYRAKVREAIESGAPLPKIPAIRDALADAAAALLRLDGPGSDIIRAAIAAAFPQAPALPVTVTGMSKTGRLPPKLLPVDWAPPAPAPEPAAAPVPAPEVRPARRGFDPDNEDFQPPAFLRRV
jgi:hypothetical protein